MSGHEECFISKRNASESLQYALYGAFNGVCVLGEGEGGGGS